MRNPTLAMLALSLALHISTARAEEGGSESGGGENSVVCFSNPAIPYAIRDKNSPRYGQILDSEMSAITSVEAYDLYEAKMPRGFGQAPQEIIGRLPNEDIRAYAERIANRFDPYIPNVGKLIRYGSKVFTDDRVIMRSSGLNRIHDENDVGYIDASRCVVATMALQYETGQETRLQVDRRLFGHSLNSPVSQAVLYLHESIYYTARMAGHKDSRPTRAAVSALINRAPIDSVSLLGLLQRLQMPLAGEGDNLLSAKAADFFQAELKKLNASLGKRAEKENRAFVRRYNAWVDNYLDTMYFHTIDTGGGNNPGPEEHLDAAYAAMERGLRDWHGSPQETIKSMCRRRRSGCEALGISLYRDMHQAEEKMRQDAAAALLRITRESFFPQIDRLGQFDAATKTAAKAAIEQSIQAGQMNAKNYQDDAEFGFFFDDKQSPAQKLRELHFMIP